MTRKVYPTYKNIKHWATVYAAGGLEDRRAVQDMQLCETAEFIRALQVELMNVSQGNFDEVIMGKLIGRARSVKYGSFQEWAKTMLRWLSEFKP